jgi:Family of unknown function (DUF6390)
MGRDQEGREAGLKGGRGTQTGLDGALLHAKHAFMPNSLGYCGPDDRGAILGHLQSSSVSPGLLAVLKSFEAAYPFVKLIARSAGADPFDYRVPEAYWIGNGLLKGVDVEDFYRFTHQELDGRRQPDVKKAFEALGERALPHHGFHVMSTYLTSEVADGPSVTNSNERKVSELIDRCRITPARVEAVEGKFLRVRSRPVRLRDGELSLSGAVVQKVGFDREIRPFDAVKAGDWVSVHWGFAAEVLTPRQAGNLGRFTGLDVSAANTLLKGIGHRR